MLEAFEAIEGGVGLHGDAADSRVQLRRRRVVPTKVPVVPKRSDEVRDLAFGLLPDLVGGGAVMGAPVLIVGVLVGVVVAAGLSGGEFAGFADGSVGTVSGVGPDDLGAVGGEVASCARARR